MVTSHSTPRRTTSVRSQTTPAGERARRPATPTSVNHFAPPLAGRTGQAAFALAHYLSQTEWWTAERLAAMQRLQATELVRFATATLAFWRDRLDGVVEVSRKNLSTDAFNAIPILTRQELQEAGAALISPTLPRGHGPTFDVHTSGSSGRPVHVRSTRLSNITNLAAALRGHQWFRRDLAGANVTIKVLASSREWRRADSWATGSTGRALEYNNKIRVDQLYNWLLRDDPHYLQCHPSILQELIHRSIEIGATPRRLRDVRTMGEILEPGLRAFCLREWGVPVRDNYSSEEFGTLAITCPESGHLHVQAERAIVEIVDDQDRPCAPGETGRVVVTGLMNFATPLIRHDLGDRAIVGPPCPCGRGLPVIERVIGRERHPVILPDGARVFPVLDAEPLLLKSGVRQYQLVQRSSDRIALMLVAKRKLSDANAADIKRHLQRNFGYPFNIDLVYVDAIPRGPGGKFQIYRSDLTSPSD